MRIARTAATLALLLATTACDAATPTSPDRGHGGGAQSGRNELVSPAPAAPRMGGNYIGSGN